MSLLGLWQKFLETLYWILWPEAYAAEKETSKKLPPPFSVKREYQPIPEVKEVTEAKALLANMRQCLIENHL